MNKPFSNGLDNDISTFKQKKKELIESMMNDDIFANERKSMKRQLRSQDNSHHMTHRERASAMRMEEDMKALEKEREALFVTGDDSISRLRSKHPFKLPVEHEVVPPHESSIWPESRPHFDLVSSYDTMVDYLGIREKSKK